MRENADRGRIDDIEALRAIAVLFTVFHHSGGNLFVWGPEFIRDLSRYATFWGGVDLFLVISGFVIARELVPFLTDQRGEQFWRGAIAFWIKRAFRIWPTSFLWAALLVVFSIVFRRTGIPQSFQQNLADFTAVLMHVQNIHLHVCQGIGQCGDMGPWWSLSLEEQFYILLPIAIFAFRKRLPFFLCVVVLTQIFLPRLPSTVIAALRSDALALGVLLALFSRSRVYREIDPVFMRKPVYGFIVVAVFVMLLATLPPIGQQKLEVVPFATGLLGVASLVLVFIASFDRGYIARGPLKPALMWIGSRSFGIYLIHVPAMILTRLFWRYIEPSGTVFGPSYTLRFTVVCLLLLVCLVEINYRLLEKPLRMKGRAISAKFRALPSKNLELTPRFEAPSISAGPAPMPER